MEKSKYEIQVLGRQMIRSGTSVAANYREACRARSSAEFIAKLQICVQEADETSLWLELLREECRVDSRLLHSSERECQELIAIMITMISRSRK